MRFEQPVNYDLVCTLNFMEINLKKEVDNSDVNKLLMEEVLKREVIEGEKAAKAQKQIRKFYNKVSRKSIAKKTVKDEPGRL